MTESPATSFGTLVPVDLREAWTREDTHFTPWLARAENLRLIADAIGLELELQGEEQDVGAFRADILCQVVSDGALVVIENQIERTDHKHLGQLITYAAGLDAEAIVWIAARFSEEHRAALDWLNQVSHEKIRFFGLEVELWRIGNSPVAPKFNVVAKPNDWSKLVRDSASGGATTDHQAFRREFWTGFLGHLEERHSTLNPRRTPTTQPWMMWTLGDSRWHISASVGFRDGYIDAALVARGHDLYSDFERRKSELEEAMGEHLVWEFSDSRKQNYARVRRTDVDPMNRADWPNQWAWLAEKLESLERALRPHVARLRGLPESISATSEQRGGPSREVR